MARVKNNAVVKGFSGSLEDIVFKTYRYGTVISKRPNMSKVKRTRSQKQASENFMNAVEYARGVVASPALKKKYEKESKKTGRSCYHLALSDYLTNSTKSASSTARKKA
jgi:hypothetical protein